MRIDIKGYIGEEVLAKDIESQLMQSNGEADIYIDSNGGEVFEGYKIGALIRQYAPNAVAKIEGNCASIATYIACSCKSRLVNEKNISEHPFMIHNPRPVGLDGDSIQLLEVVDELKRIEGELKLAYTFTSGIKDKELTEMMSKETSFSVPDAISRGFIDGYYTEEVKEVINNKVLNYVNVSNMEKNEQDVSSLVKMMNGMSEKLNKVFKKVVNVVDTTVSGDQVFLDAESVEESIGAAVYTVVDGESTGESVADGEYEMVSGFIVNVLDGLVESVSEVDIEAREKDQVIEDLKSQILTKDEEISTFNAKLEELKAKFTTIENSLEEANKKTVVGEQIPKTTIVDEVKEEGKVKGLIFKNKK